MASGPGEMLVLELRLQPGEPISGTIGLHGEDRPLSFHGWIEFIIVLAKLRRGVTPRDANGGGA